MFLNFCIYAIHIRYPICVVLLNIIHIFHTYQVPSVSHESSQVEFESILKYYLYSGIYPINCLNYIIYIMRVYISLYTSQIWNTTGTWYVPDSINFDQCSSLVILELWYFGSRDVQEVGYFFLFSSVFFFFLCSNFFSF
jgi:hypothetical protein